MLNSAGGGDRPVRCQKQRELPRGERAREQESLDLVAAQIPQHVELVLGLDALRCNAHAQAQAKLDDRGEDDRAVVWSADALDEAAVDLQFVEPEPVQILLE